MADYSDTDLLDVGVKAAAAKVSQSVVSVVSRDLSDEMKQHLGKRKRVRVSRDGECVFISSGIIIKCHEEEKEEDGKFSVTIITSATIFVRTNGVDPTLVKVRERATFSVFFSQDCVRPQITELNCNEIYWVKSDDFHSADRGPVVNYSGEVIGVMFYGRAFLPINIVARWWDHYKRNREYRRPRIGVEVANLYSICVAFLEQFAKSFPNVSTGVIVTKVEQDSPAYCSGIQPKDFIVKCDGKLVCSNLEFFETIWEKLSRQMCRVRCSKDKQWRGAKVIYDCGRSQLR